MVLKSKRKEAWMRIPVGIISGVVMYVWFCLIALFFVINFVYGIFSGKKLKDLSNMSEDWNTQNYFFMRYMTFCSDERPFPFEGLKKEINKIED